MTDAHTGKLLIVDDEKVALKNLEHVMKKEGYAVTATQSGSAALALLEKESFDVVLTDLRMEKVDGMKVLDACRKLAPDAEVIMITGFATLESAVEAMKFGAFHYIAKPFRLEEVRAVVAEAMEKVSLKHENARLREQLAQWQGSPELISQDPAIRRLLDTARQVAPSECSVLISGQSGTGKELLARFVHQHSKRADGPFLAVNCGAFNEDLLANELFGHDKGAFTGAAESRKGLIEAASGGTLFLDEITEMSPAMQAKLLRVIQEQEVLRLGSTEPVRVNVRFIAATNQDIRQAVETGKVRQDLYFRLNVVALHLPPLAERRQDIPLLCQHFLAKHSARMGKTVTHLSRETLSALMNYGFPGNVRELENLLARGVAVTDGPVLELAHLPEEIAHPERPAFDKPEGRIPTLEEQEVAYIRWVLAEAKGNQTLAAQMLGIDRVSLWRKLKRQRAEN